MKKIERQSEKKITVANGYNKNDVVVKMHIYRLMLWRL